MESEKEEATLLLTVIESKNSIIIKIIVDGIEYSLKKILKYQ